MRSPAAGGVYTCAPAFKLVTSHLGHGLWALGPGAQGQAGSTCTSSRPGERLSQVPLLPHGRGSSQLEGWSLTSEYLLRAYYVSGIDLSAQTREAKSPAARKFIPVWETK